MIVFIFVFVLIQIKLVCDVGTVFFAIVKFTHQCNWRCRTRDHLCKHNFHRILLFFHLVRKKTRWILKLILIVDVVGFFLFFIFAVVVSLCPLAIEQRCENWSHFWHELQLYRLQSNNSNNKKSGNERGGKLHLASEAYREIKKEKTIISYENIDLNYIELLLFVTFFFSNHMQIAVFCFVLTTSTIIVMTMTVMVSTVEMRRNNRHLIHFVSMIYRHLKIICGTNTNNNLYLTSDEMAHILWFVWKGNRFDGKLNK